MESVERTGVAVGPTERRIQQEYGTADRAQRFYDTQVLDHLNARMRDFVGRQEMMFLSTADLDGHCDSTFRAGPPGFVHVLSEAEVTFMMRPGA